MYNILQNKSLYNLYSTGKGDGDLASGNCSTRTSLFVEMSSLEISSGHVSSPLLFVRYSSHRVGQLSFDQKTTIKYVL